MSPYQLIDYSCIEESPEMVLDFAIVTLNNIGRVKKAVPHDQRDHVEKNDELAVYAVKESGGDGKRRLTVWFNKEIAAIETSDGSIWGDWDDDEELLLTEEIETAQDIEESTIIGRRAYNIYGICGIYALGRFYSLVAGGSEDEARRHEPVSAKFSGS
jgi:hypothetical protein